METAMPVARELWKKLREPISGTPAEMMQAELDDIEQALTQFAEERKNEQRHASFMKGYAQGFSECREKAAEIAQEHGNDVLGLHPDKTKFRNAIAIKIRALTPEGKEIR